MTFVPSKQKHSRKEWRRENSRNIMRFWHKEAGLGRSPDEHRDKDPYYEEIGENLRIAREGIHHTQEEFASLLGISQQEISNIERGKAGMTVRQLYILLRYSPSIDANTLFGRPALSDDPLIKACLQAKAKLKPEIIRFITYLLFLLIYKDDEKARKSLGEYEKE